MYTMAFSGHYGFIFSPNYWLGHEFTLTEDLVMNALKMDLFQRHVAFDVLLHSDCGSQYASHNYQALLKNHGILCSMSRKKTVGSSDICGEKFRSLNRIE